MAANSCNPPPAGQILFTGFTTTVCPPSLARHAKIGQELGDQRQGYPLEVGRGERGDSGGESERETDGIMGRERVRQAERKGSPRDLAVLYHN